MERITHTAYRFFHGEGDFSRIEKPSIYPRPSAAPSIFHELVERLSTLHLSSGISSKRATIRRVVAGGQRLRSDLAVHATLAISRCAVMRDRAAIVKMERGGGPGGGRQTERETRHVLPAAAGTPPSVSNAEVEEQ